MGRKKRHCFVICPIGESGSAIRRRSDRVLELLIQPALRERGYGRAVRADRIRKPGIITVQIIEEVVKADLIIADLTGGNPNVFYELAVRHIARKPLVMISEEGQQIPFDISPARVVFYDSTDDSTLQKVKKELGDQITAAEEGGQAVHNPVSVSLDLLELKASSDPEKTALAELVGAVADLAHDADGQLYELMEEIKDLKESIEALGSGQEGLAWRLDNLEAMLPGNGPHA